MKAKLIFAIACSLIFILPAQSQKTQSLKEIRAMMKQAREISTSPCFLVMNNKDTVSGNKLEKKWNKKLKIEEWELDDKTFVADSIIYYQDEDGFHSRYAYFPGGSRMRDDLARIINGKIDVFVSNWESHGGTSTFNPSSGYSNPGPTVRSQYYVRKKGAPSAVLTVTLKSYIKDNDAALAQYEKEFGTEMKLPGEITNWGALKRIFDIYND